jgi:hypothetical protein
MAQDLEAGPATSVTVFGDLFSDTAGGASEKSERRLSRRELQ